MSEQDRFSGTQYAGPLNYMTQFSYIAREAIPNEFIYSVVAKRNVGTKLVIEAAGKGVNEQGDILNPFT